MTIDTKFSEKNAEKPSAGWQLNCATGEIRPSAWEAGTRVRVENLFAKTPARLKFLRGDRAEMMAVAEIVKRMAMARPDVGFFLNDKWKFSKNQPLTDRIAAVMGEEVRGRMLEIDAGSPGSDSPEGTGRNSLRLRGHISEPTLRRASSVDQYLFVNGRPVKDKVLVGALRASYMDVMHAREFPLCALYLQINPREVDVNVSPAKTEVHFLEPARVRGFIIKTLRDALARTMSADSHADHDRDFWSVRGRALQAGLGRPFDFGPARAIQNQGQGLPAPAPADEPPALGSDFPLGRVIGQIGNKYIIAENESGLVIVDQHAAHERITYERLRRHELKAQPLLLPIVVEMKPEQAAAVMEAAEELRSCGLDVEQFGEDAVSIQEKPADWDLDWNALLRSIADEVSANGHSSQLSEKLHLKLANHACHNSVRAGQKLSAESMNALLRDIENTQRGGECNHGRPVCRFIPFGELDGWFER